MRRIRQTDAGFSLPELLVAMGIMLVISGAAVTALMRMMSAQATVWNRTQMHSGIRGATEVLQQEVGQAGRIALPAAVTMTGATAAGATGATVTLPVSSSTGMFVGMKLTVGSGLQQETVQVTNVPNATSVIVQSLVSTTGVGAKDNNSPVLALGSFTSGIVPPNMTNGSTGTVLKLYGDINDDGNMVYIEYTCDTAGHNLYRNMMPFTATTKPPLAASQILLSNITANPGGTACFTYQTETVNGNTYVIDVAITLTVETQLIDPVTKAKQTETKALLNVSPRNVFGAWQMASLTIADRIQLIPPSVTALLP
jgi:prepilin-type N-terminal cleavage/methylation domain-containing protein